MHQVSMSIFKDLSYHVGISSHMEDAYTTSHLHMSTLAHAYAYAHTCIEPKEYGFIDIISCRKLHYFCLNNNNNK